MNVEAHWPDGTITRATVTSETVQRPVGSAWTVAGQQVVYETGLPTTTWCLQWPEAQKLLAPLRLNWDDDRDREEFVFATTLHDPAEPDWYALGFGLRCHTLICELVFCWQLTPAAQARRDEATQQARAEAQAQAQALTASVPDGSLRWIYHQWWYDEYDDGESLQIECPLCHAFSPDRDKEEEGIQAYRLDALPAISLCTTCHQTMWIERRMLNPIPEPGGEDWEGDD
jgi:hypothetical protein